MSQMACGEVEATPVSALDAPALHAPRTRAGSMRPRLARDPASEGATRPRLLEHRARRYSPGRMPVLFGAMAVLATVLIFALMVAWPSVLETDSRAPHALLHTPARIAALSALQRDSLLAGACWLYTCDLNEK